MAGKALGGGEEDVIPFIGGLGELLQTPQVVVAHEYRHPVGFGGQGHGFSDRPKAVGAFFNEIPQQDKVIGTRPVAHPREQTAQKMRMAVDVADHDDTAPRGKFDGADTGEHGHFSLGINCKDTRLF